MAGGAYAARQRARVSPNMGGSAGGGSANQPVAAISRDGGGNGAGWCWDSHGHPECLRSSQAPHCAGGGNSPHGAPYQLWGGSGILGPWQGDKLMGPELGAPGDVQPGLQVLVPAGCAAGAGGAGRRCREPATWCNCGPSLCFSTCRRGRAQLWGPAVGGSGCCPGPCPGADVRSVLCGFGLVFLFAHVFFFFPTTSPACLPSMSLLHAPVCKLVGWVGASPLPLPVPATCFGEKESGLDQLILV